MGERTNRGVVYRAPGVVVIEPIPFPRLFNEAQKRKCEHGVIIKIIVTNICGSDQHWTTGRLPIDPGTVLGHEMTGEVIEVGSEVEYIKLGDIVSVPFNVACGRCRDCKEGNTNICSNANPGGLACYGAPRCGEWIGGQAEYAMVPYADFNLTVFRDKTKAMDKIKDLALVSDIFPTGFHGAVTAGVGPGATVYIAGAGPVGLACAASSFLLGAAVVIVADLNKERLAQAKKIGCEIVDISKDEPIPEQIRNILGVPFVECAVDCVGFSAHGSGVEGHKKEQPAHVLNTSIEVTRPGGKIGVPGLYALGDAKATDENARKGALSLRLGLAWAKSISIASGICPVAKYQNRLINCIMYDRVKIAEAVNAQVISLDEAPQGYVDFEKGAAKKFLIDPHNIVRTWGHK